MTIKELYIWAMQNGLSELPIAFEHRDIGGPYPTDTYSEKCDGYEVVPDVEISDSGESYVCLYCTKKTKA